MSEERRGGTTAIVKVSWWFSDEAKKFINEWTAAREAEYQRLWGHLAKK